MIAAATLAIRVDDRTELAARALAVARSTALGVLGDPAAAEDVAQEVAIVAIQDPRKLDAWLRKVATRKAIDETRKRKRRPTVPLEAHHDPTDAPREAALHLLAPLAPRQRAALTLRYVHDLPDDAIARALGCRPATVRSRPAAAGTPRRRACTTTCCATSCCCSRTPTRRPSSARR
jgi:RNA polymerase sigma-70 factor (ECF subfamily)